MQTQLFTHPAPPVHPGEYVVTVQIVRHMGDDLDAIATKAAGVDLGQALAAQVARELQAAFDDGAAGRFQVTGVAA